MTNSVLIDFELSILAFFNEVKDDFVKFAHAFIPAVESLVEIAFKDLAAIAGQAVLTEAEKAIAGSEKFGNAVANVIQTVEAQGKTVILQTAHAAVQVAYLAAQEAAKTVVSVSK